jgi:hypothetical protein
MYDGMFMLTERESVGDFRQAGKKKVRAQGASAKKTLPSYPDTTAIPITITFIRNLLTRSGY